MCTLHIPMMVPIFSVDINIAEIEQIHIIEIQFLPSSLFSVLCDDLHRCYSKVYYVRTVSLPDIDAAFENDYCIQITEIGFR
jgi:hypothetical protein